MQQNTGAYFLQMWKKTIQSGFITFLLFSSTVLAQQTEKPELRKNLLHQIKFGVLAHDVGNLWSGFNREGGVDLNIEAVFGPSLKILGGTMRPAIGGSINTAGDTSKGYIDALWQYDFDTGIFFMAGIGVAIHNGKKSLVSNKRKALGSRALFHIPIELGYYLTSQTSISIYFDHISNAYTANKNEGMDTLGVRFGYIF